MEKTVATEIKLENVNLNESSDSEGEHHRSRTSTICSHLNSSSFVAASKLTNSTSVQQSFLWISYVLIMISLLILSLFNTITVYHKYEKSIQISKKIHASSDFPAVTVCSRTPFSKNALEIWASGKVQSPLKFSQNLRQKMKQRWLDHDATNATFLFNFDRINYYYSNLTYNESRMVSHSLHKFLLQSMIYLEEETMVINSMSEINPGDIDIIHFSHREFFTCFIFQIKKKDRKNVTSLRLVIDLNSTIPLYSPGLRGTLGKGIHEQAAGLRVLLHENDLRPHVDQYGVDIEPNKKVEFVYSATEHQRLNTLTDPCVTNEKLINTQIHDLEHIFKYTVKDCIGYQVNRHLINNCGCMVPMYVKPVLPSAETPYCFSINTEKMDEIFNRTNCYSKHKRLPLAQMKQCIQRCNYIKYKYHASYSKWTATRWQLDWWQANVKAMMAGKTINITNNRDIEKLLKAMKILELEAGEISVHQQNATQITRQHISTVHLTVRKATANVAYHEEKLLLPFTEMLSQIGGLLGLYLGLSCAILVEIVDLCLCIFSSHSRTHKNSKQNRNHIKKKVKHCFTSL